MRFGNIEEFTRFLGNREAAILAGRKKGMEVAAKMLVQTATDMIGEQIEQWTDLAPATVEEKNRLGFTGQVSATDPLLRTGELRASIGSTIEGNKLMIGSNDPAAVWQEEGTAHIPPRPFIGATMHMFGRDAADTIATFELGAAMGLSGPLKPPPHHQGGG